MTLWPKEVAIDFVGNFAAGSSTRHRFSEGGLYVEWYDAATAEWSGLARELTPGGTSAHPIFDANGALHAIWNAPSVSGGADAIWTGRLDRAARAVVDAKMLSSTDIEHGLRVSGTPQGSGAATWVRLSGSRGYCRGATNGCEVVTSTFDGATGTWAAPQVIATNALPEASVAAASNGNAITAWTNGQGPVSADAGASVPNTAVYASYFVRDRGWDPPQKIASTLQSDVTFESTKVVTNGRGDAFVFWMQYDATASSDAPHELWSVRRSCRGAP